MMGTEKQVLAKWDKYRLASISLSQNESSQRGKTDSPVKKKFLVQQSIKKVILSVDFLEKGATVNSASFC